ncbi:MAG: beta-glucosidase BglX [Phycisphaerales bacterium]|nr:beta-glucosidase BglX [Phycisphaerales bacterium]
MNTATIACPLIASVVSLSFAAAPTPDQRALDLLQRMTLEEKVGQLVQFSDGMATGPDRVKVDQTALLNKGGIGSLLNAVGAHKTNALQKIAVEKSRLGVPLLFGLDVIHGYRTTFPVPLGLSAAWDPSLIERTARVAAAEAAAGGIRWTFAPMVDIARDPRWGRIMEGSGEDPYLGSALAVAAVRGYQGGIGTANLAQPTSILACAKHFVAYGGAEGGRDYNTVDISERVLRDVYLPPFRAASDAGVVTFMSAFNALNGVPTSANHHTLTGILRNEWKFDGFVVSDWTSVAELIPHGIALDDRTAALKGFASGVDMDMQANLYAAELPGLVRAGKVSEQAVDASVRRILRAKFELGLFENPYVNADAEAAAMLKPEYIALAREAAEQSFVLLKNYAATGDAGGRPVLPLAANARIALIGPLADDAEEMLGGWSCQGKKEDVITLRASLAERFGSAVTYAQGTTITGGSREGFAAALDAAKNADFVIMALGESRHMSGEAASRTRLDLPGNQLDLLKEVDKLGKPIVLVAFSGRPLTLAWEAANIPAILMAWYPGLQAGPALTRVLTGEVSPSGKLTATMPRAVGQVPIYYNHLKTGRPVPGPDDVSKDQGYKFLSRYVDEDGSPLYPFGHGLTYTTFTYGPTKASTKEISVNALRNGATIEIESAVTNTGSRSGTEIAQLYIRQRGTSVARPVRELKGFEKFTLEPGQTRAVKFKLTAAELAFWNIDTQLAVEPCELTVWVAASSITGTPTKVMIHE